MLDRIRGLLPTWSTTPTPTVTLPASAASDEKKKAETPDDDFVVVRKEKREKSFAAVENVVLVASPKPAPVVTPPKAVTPPTKKPTAAPLDYAGMMKRLQITAQQASEKRTAALQDEALVAVKKLYAQPKAKKAPRQSTAPAQSTNSGIEHSNPFSVLSDESDSPTVAQTPARRAGR